MTNQDPPSSNPGGLRTINLTRDMNAYPITESELTNIFGLRATATIALAAASALGGHAFSEDGWLNVYFFVALAFLFGAMWSHHKVTSKIKEESWQQGKTTMHSS